MDKNYVLENEYDVNRVMLNIFKIMIGVIPLTWLFKVINLFIVPWNIIVFVSVTILILAGLPLIIFKDYKNTKIKIYSDVIAKAPTRFLVAGMGDALATYFEARSAVGLMEKICLEETLLKQLCL